MTQAPAYDLADRFRSGAPPVLLTGVQAVARLLVEQRALDRRRGHRTATFVSGYQGSPLGGLDRLLDGMPEVLRDNDIVFRPGLNEELAATAVWGSQSRLPQGSPTHEGVVGVWYGKAPGVDRSTDVLRHANMYGVDPRGGVVVLAGDDPAAKSSTVPAVSERTLAALGIPVLFPRNAADVVALGLHAVELSRASGCVVGLKIVADVADGAWTVDDSVSALDPVIPTLDWHGAPWAYRQHSPTVGSARIVAVEEELVGPRTAMVHAYAVANGLNPLTVAPAQARVGLVAAGTAYDSMMQALRDLGPTEDDLERAGIRVLRVGLIHPLEPDGVVAFAEGLQLIVVVEDKSAFIETQLRGVLYGRAGAPVVVGKVDRQGEALIPAAGELTPGRLADPLRRVLSEWVELAPPARTERTALPLMDVRRAPYFCSGCPHNRSTALPDGSLGAGGIGCHTLVVTSRRTDSAITGFTQMGGEGAQWIGQSPFTTEAHTFQNIGDGTFFHSGQLALQACVAAGVNITYKILHNQVVAMTGAQEAEGALDLPALTHKLAAEGVARIIVCADEPERHRAFEMSKGTVVWHRDRLDEAQRVLRDIAGVTVLIYDQHCAADARRQRKRGTLGPRPMRVVINEAVCEGCGDCGVKSNCLSVQPVDTEFGEKTRIDQSSCNTDYSCLLGDCPAFMSVSVDPARRPSRVAAPVPPAVPDPRWSAVGTDGGVTPAPQSVLLAGIGGTGIVTVNQVLGTAALRAGYAVEILDQIGLSQKAGPVVGHLRFAPVGELGPSNRLSPRGADAIIAFDLLAAADEANLGYGDPGRTIVVASTSRTPTGDMVYDRAIPYPQIQTLMDRLRSASSAIHTLDMVAQAQALFGTTAAANFLLVGVAHQVGALRLPAAAIEEAIAINGVAVAANVAAFRWGRAAIADPAAFATASTPVVTHVKAAPSLPSLAAASFGGETRRLAAVRAAELVEFQDAELAADYVGVIEQVWLAERTVTDETRLSEAVARFLFKLTAYKDEYEVARLLTRPGVADAVEADVPGGASLTFHLHPPTARALGKASKSRFTPASHAVLRALARQRRLRGSAIDPFGRARVRRVERELIAHYRRTLHTLVARLSAQSYDAAVAFAELPDLVRGYEGVKLRSVDAYVARLQELGLPTPDLPR